jgi:hypothetical protein
MNQFCGHNELFHWLEAIKSCAINIFSYNYSNLYNMLVRILAGPRSLFSLGLDGNKFSVGNNGCNPYTS